MADNNDDVPFMQKLLDNHFLLLFLGVVSPGCLYIPMGHHRHHEYPARQTQAN